MEQAVSQKTTLSPTPTALAEAINTLTALQLEVAVQATQTLRAMLEPHKDRLKEVWIQREDDLRTISLFIRLKHVSLDTFEAINGVITDFDVAMAQNTHSPDPRWRPSVQTLTFRHNEKITRYMKFDAERAEQIQL